MNTETHHPLPKHELRAPSRQSGRFLGAWLIWLALLPVLGLGGAAGGLWWWSRQSLPLRTDTVELAIERGQTPRQVAQAWVDAGVEAPSWLLYQWFRWSQQAQGIKAGSYEATRGITPQRLLSMMVRGDESLATVKLIEGWTFARWRQEMAQSPGLSPRTAGLSDAQVMAALGSPGLPAEGQFLPDTYSYAKGSPDLAVMQRAHRAMLRQLGRVWEARAPGLRLETPQQALIMASLIEKETGHADDRGMVSSVFHNRLRIGMPLQTDPTVIYGLGARFDGNLRRSDLLADTPFNTYTRGGLPPTPIAMPGKASLMAAVQPESSQALYFVAKGGGRSAFSDTLSDHNRAVNRYIRNRP